MGEVNRDRGADLEALESPLSNAGDCSALKGAVVVGGEFSHGNLAPLNHSLGVGLGAITTMEGVGDSISKLSHDPAVGLNADQVFANMPTPADGTLSTISSGEEFKHQP